MNTDVAVALARQTVYTALLISGPMLLAGLVVGLLLGIFQAVTSLHEQTLVLVPKILAVMGVTLILLPWILKIILSFTTPLLGNLGRVAP
jgi:flagellar biosynthetic protein FliQ